MLWIVKHIENLFKYNGIFPCINVQAVLAREQLEYSSVSTEVPSSILVSSVGQLWWPMSEFWLFSGLYTLQYPPTTRHFMRNKSSA